LVKEGHSSQLFAAVLLPALKPRHQPQVHSAQFDKCDQVNTTRVSICSLASAYLLLIDTPVLTSLSLAVSLAIMSYPSTPCT
jgi:hypothetical protein